MIQAKVTASYSRKTQPPGRAYEYESEEAMLSVSFTETFPSADEDPDAPDPAAIEEYVNGRFRTLQDTVRTKVLTQLGIEYRINDAGEIEEVPQVVAQVAQQFPGAVVQPPAQPVAPPPAAQPGVPAPPPAGALACPKCGGPMFDDRGNNARKRAGGFKLRHDGKCKNQNCSDDSGRRTVVWPDDYQTYKNNPLEPKAA